MSSAIKITLYRTMTETPIRMTAAEFREFAKGTEEFASVRITQEGMGGVLGDMYVYIDNRANGEYVCKIQGAGFSAQRCVERVALWATLMDGYGLWALNQ